MFDRNECKYCAKEQIKGHVLILLLATIMPVLTAAVLGLLPVLGVMIAALIAPVLSVGVLVVFLNRASNNPHSPSQVFSLLSYWWKAFCLSFSIAWRVFLWSMLLYIPGIIATYRYSMAFYIFAEHPDMPNSEILHHCRSLTEGHKWDLFILSLSFIGWIFLIYCTAGLAAIWVIPYINATYANVYLSMRTNHRRY